MSPTGVALFFGPHPDDIELFAGGTAARLARLGHRVVLCDLTRGEMASNGTPEQRADEAERAATLLGAAERSNLGLPDAGLREDDAAQTGVVAAAIRAYRPDLVFAPAVHGRHPDHSAAGALVRRAVYVAGLRNADVDGEVHRPASLLHYICRVACTPTLVVPLGAEDVAAKQNAIAAHASQLAGAGGVATLISDSDAIAAIQARDAYWGAHAGFPAAEAFVSSRLVVDDDPVATALKFPATRVHWFTGDAE